MRLAAALVAFLVPAAAVAKETAGPSLLGAYAIERDSGEGDVGLGLGFEGRVSGAPALSAGMDLAWAFAAESLSLDLHFGLGVSIATIDVVVQGAAGSPGAGLSLGPELSLAIPFPFVGDASLASVFGRYDHFVLGADDYPHQIVAGLRFVLDVTRTRR